ncbi:hypothetical protein [Nonomuraea sp. B5E05]|uniref:hypothetical protein n=1 Tax=Nonomuraea sp. B5E05 TaxID=3153569 RepID=UPI00326115CF
MLLTRVETVSAMVVSRSPASVRIQAAAASATAVTPAGAVSVTSTDRSPETSPSPHTRVPGREVLVRVEPERTDNARTASSSEAASPTVTASAREPPAGSSQSAPGSLACSGMTTPGPGLQAG